eukprot:CAMPEP_0167798650 /NCGR_PEP_ID=MMETSP0111_2-20121227/16473_1 /TAXON_ID=91324 /ORGANISM="Lotharella globosa, Strain CCCM811" /LENGTH=254 /DNA_ID=CAMNT_0007693181 /DNA_START=39 /DNA_END=800 /DNA_ORIENTATION=-
MTRVDEQEGSEGATCVMLATAKGHVKVVEACVEAKADVEIADNAGRFPLLIAIEKRRLDIVRVLLNAGANPNRCPPDGRSFVFAECLRKKPDDPAAPSRDEWIKALVMARAVPKPDEKDSWGNTMLHRALLTATASDGWGRPAVNILLRALPSLVRLRNNDGETPLHLAAKTGIPEVIESVLTYGAHPNARVPRNGKTPLHGAHNARATAALLKGGARLDLVDKRGNKPRDVTRGRKAFINLVDNAQEFWRSLD